MGGEQSKARFNLSPRPVGTPVDGDGVASFAWSHNMNTFFWFVFFFFCGRWGGQWMRMCKQQRNMEQKEFWNGVGGRLYIISTQKGKKKLGEKNLNDNFNTTGCGDSITSSGNNSLSSLCCANPAMLAMVILLVAFRYKIQGWPVLHGSTDQCLKMGGLKFWNKRLVFEMASMEDKDEDVVDDESIPEHPLFLISCPRDEDFEKNHALGALAALIDEPSTAPSSDQENVVDDISNSSELTKTNSIDEAETSEIVYRHSSQASVGGRLKNNSSTYTRHERRTSSKADRRPQPYAMTTVANSFSNSSGKSDSFVSKRKRPTLGQAQICLALTSID
jgi:hypothetical protein